ncbi:cyclase dehydrase [Aestuariivirga sp.]|uniref:cyclase dehydrase n=1 Tax=Aestuariivirga sp. TaxID=2650926 RepID=UPI003BAD7BCE
MATTRALNTSADVHRQSGSDAMARGLGVLSLALGAVELAGARPLARMLGLRGQENFIRFCGAREIMQGVAILSAKDPTPWVWARVAGDVLDIGTLAIEHGLAHPSKRQNVTLALGTVLGITVLDVMTARQLSQENREPWSTNIDFSTRSGLPGRGEVPRRGRSRAEAEGRSEPPVPSHFVSRGLNGGAHPAEAM